MAGVAQCIVPSRVEATPMATNAEFVELIARVRRGDQQATAELVRMYEPEVRRFINARHTDERIRPSFGASDVYQNVMMSFFVRVALGEYEINAPEQLIALLTTMGRNKLVNHIEREQAGKRDVRRIGQEEVTNLPNQAVDTPSQIAMGRELLANVRRQMTSRELYLVEQRASGRSWEELAKEVGEPADTLRMRCSRAIDRVGRDMGFHEEPA
ncbi:MAG: sigma-70 family RNA polymerase sigma factor [Planctomycetes bacterium]|nr:sigma-70 family RNA polymerase sigma factor [Planctomycetota bacterium]